MKNRVTLQMEGGLGKQVALTSLIPYFKDKYKQLIVLSSFPEVFEFHPDVYRAIGYDTAFAFEEYINPSDDIFYACGYRQNNFRKQRMHLIDAACESINITKQDNMKPSLYTADQYEEIALELKQQFGDYILVQFHGGRNPSNLDAPKNIMAKDFPQKSTIELIQQIRNKYPNLTIINMSLPGEFPIPGTVQLDFKYSVWFSIIKHCTTFISIDSSLQHISAAFNKTGIVLWGATNPKQWGWEHNINLENNQCSLDQYHCQRPYFVPSVDLKNNGVGWECPHKICMQFENTAIIEELDKLIKDKQLQKPTINMNEVIVK